MTKLPLKSLKIGERWLEDIFVIKPRINVQQNTTNSVLLKQFDLIFTYQAGRHIKALITFGGTESVEKQVLVYSATVSIITPEGSQHCHL